MHWAHHVGPQFLSRLHSIITSWWLKLVNFCFLLVKLQLKIFLTSPWSSLCANVHNPVRKVWNVLISLTFKPAHFCTSTWFDCYQHTSVPFIWTSLCAFFCLFFNFIDQKCISHNIFIINILFDHVVGSESYWSKNVNRLYVYISRVAIYSVIIMYI